MVDVRFKKMTLKQRLIRWFDRLSNRIRPAHEPSEVGDMVEVAGIKKADGSGFYPVEISLVTHCPYCGTDDWDTPKTKPDGSICNHPTRLRVIK